MVERLRFEALGTPYNRGWRPIGVVGVLMTVVVLAQLAAAFFWTRALGRPLTEASLRELPGALSLAVLGLVAGLTLLGFLWGVHLITRQPLLLLGTVAPAPRWRRFGVGAAVTAVVVMAMTGLQALLLPGSFEAPLPWTRFLPMLAVGVLVAPLQSLFEELLFRGYLLQVLSGKHDRVRLAVALSAALFALLHLANPDVQVGGWLYGLTYYGGFGLTLALLTVREQGIELAWGIHAMNNLLSFCFIGESEEVSAYQLPVLFRSTHFVPWLSAALGLVALGLIALGTQRLWRPHHFDAESEAKARGPELA